MENPDDKPLNQVATTNPAELKDNIAEVLMDQWTNAYGTSERLGNIRFNLDSNARALSVLKDPEESRYHDIYAHHQPVEERIKQLEEENELINQKIPDLEKLETRAWQTLYSSFNELDDSKKIELLSKFKNTPGEQYPNVKSSHYHEAGLQKELFSKESEYSDSKVRNFFIQEISGLASEGLTIEDCKNLSKVMYHNPLNDGYESSLNNLIRNQLIVALSKQNPDVLETTLSEYIDSSYGYRGEKAPFGQLSWKDMAQIVGNLPQPQAERHLEKVADKVKNNEVWSGNKYVKRYEVDGYFWDFASYADLVTCTKDWSPEERAEFVLRHLTARDVDPGKMKASTIPDKSFDQTRSDVLTMIKELPKDFRVRLLNELTEDVVRVDKEIVSDYYENQLNKRSWAVYSYPQHTLEDNHIKFVEHFINDFSSDEVELLWSKIQQDPKYTDHKEGGYSSSYSRDHLFEAKLNLIILNNIPPDSTSESWVIEGLNNKSRIVQDILQKRVEFWTPRIANLLVVENGQTIRESAIEYILDQSSDKLEEYSPVIIKLLLDTNYSTQIYDKCKRKLENAQLTPEQWSKFAQILGEQLVANNEFGRDLKGNRAGSALQEILNNKQVTNLTDRNLLSSLENFMFYDELDYRFDNYKSLLEKFDPEIFEDPDVKANLIQRIKVYGQKICSKPEGITLFIENLNYLRAQIKFEKTEVENLIGIALVESLAQGLPINNILERFGDSVPDFSTFIKIQPFLDSVADNFKVTSFDGLQVFIKEHEQYFKFIRSNPDQAICLNSWDLDLLENNPFGEDLIILELAKRKGVEISDIKPNDYKTVFEAIRGSHPDWKDEQVINEPFEEGAKLFGYEKMFRYIKRNGLTVHDGLHAFKDIIYLQSVSGLEASQFYGQVLDQVSKDDSSYETGTAHHELNSIAQTLDTHFADIAQMATEFPEIEGLVEIAEKYSKPEQVFGSWNNLKRYSKLSQLIEQRGVLMSLKDIKNEKLRKYVSRLAFHKDSKVDMQAAIQFATQPRAFLEREASHTPDQIQDRKKPSNYIDIPNLDLSAEELVEALVEGKMDTLSVFTPMEVSYTVIVDEDAEDVRALLKRALGQRGKEGVSEVKGQAQDPKKLFSEMGKVLKANGTTLQEYLAGKDIPSEKVKEVEDQMFSILFDEKFGMRKNALRTQKFVAKIGYKSDPDMVLAGDDTVNCMPFGDGKTTVYTFNPNTAQFVLQVEKADGTMRTIAQSVLTKDINIRKPIPEVIQRLERQGEHLIEVLPDDLLAKQTAVIACDNVEVSPNFSDQTETIELLYRDFFSEYVKKHGEKQNLETERVIVGEGYSDALNNIPEIDNTYAPQAPVSYTDKTGEKVRVLDLKADGAGRSILKKEVKAEELPSKVETELPSIRGLEYLTFEHAMQVAFIEGKAYSDNESLMQYLHNMENGLIAKDINNSAKDRPNMSLAYRDKTGKMQGYMLAYEGKLSEQDEEYYEKESEGESVIYISDTAVSDKSSMAGARAGTALVEGFADLYKRNYIETGKLTPIFAQAREETSYRLIKRKLDELSKEVGVKFELEELPTYEVGDSTMHPVIIRPVK